ncbi:MAG: response regulator transcription factor [Epsilonproteobacteria bacterium]|nr:response regulator transcription factor [Campylobacterota bacterium]OIO17855.1 MAG: DNA-binding response regulator [Helicobacteraceae bacterium CG1_02_36_14]PIP10033.1 MAG: DNA-binding response regulator [Sulfurimonas sp. CG23_combo_of_CG06-09_8_20_14_all_36_33]PIS25838.1 MAG: DNA-binding response regulator [Sulfurimonas sp. CG08_land_8_20_14_0_20_36_33]PIU35723.1 MAG: DNA-binding response regulator [Sulfurimonas sp. CG07_land_8_20_14_0_80_36_56]PIV05329.1 MAG: DNA-binding response regulato
MKILLMEDDAVLSDILLDFLRESWHVDYAFNPQEVYTKLETNRYDLFIFDINVAGKNGLELLKELREFHNTTPTIIITAYTDTEYLKKAFEAGAHDYIKKPFALEELNMRILNTKRLFNIETEVAVQISETLRYFTNERRIETPEKSITLGTKDGALLEYFIRNPKRVISTEELVQNIWDFDSLPSDATIRSHIRTLRDIVGKERITTLRGNGYLYE